MVKIKSFPILPHLLTTVGNPPPESALNPHKAPLSGTFSLHVTQRTLIGRTRSHVLSRRHHVSMIPYNLAECINLEINYSTNYRADLSKYQSFQR
jgi:hypothetical protein